MSQPDAATPPRNPADLSRLIPLVIFVGALALRLWNIGWALPNATRLFSFHPDESMVVSASLTVNPLLLLLDPHFYAYGALPLLLNGAVIHLGEMVGLVGASVGGVPSSGALLAARLVTAVLGAATCFFLYGAGRLLYHRTAGTIAAILYALAPLAVQHGHFATVDVPATFFVAGTLYFAARVATGADDCSRGLLWAGVWAGLAAAAKYNAGLVLFAALAAWWLTGRGGKRLALVVGGTVLAFLVGCPTILLNPGGVLQSIRDESLHVRTGHGDVFAGTQTGLLYHLSFNLSWGLTLPLLAFILAGVFGAMVRRGRGDGLLAAFALPYYLLIGLAAVKFARYTLPLFPPLLLWTGALVGDLLTRRKPLGIAAGALCAAASAFALLFSVGLDQTMSGPDPRDEAAAYVRSLPAVHTVGFAKGPWFYSPTLAPLLAHPIPIAAQNSVMGTMNPTLIPAVRTGAGGKPQSVEWDTALLHETHPDAVAVSEFEYADAGRARVPAALDYLAALEAQYPHRRVFAYPVQVFGFGYTKLSTKRGLPTQNLPEDMRYTNPTIVIFTQ